MYELSEMLMSDSSS